MLKKIVPLLVIIFSWFIFSKSYFLENKIPYPTSYQLNALSLWNTNQNFLGPVKNPAMPDVVGQIMPWRHLTIQSWKNLETPLWNPFSFSGTPLLANYQTSAFSISNLPFFIFSFNSAWGIAVLIQPLFAGIFMYFFARSLRLNNFASIISAIAFMFSGFITTWMSWTTLSLAISFLPLSLFSIEKYFSSKKQIFLLILLATIPLSFFSGHFQTSIYFLGLTILYLLFKLFETKDKTAFLNSFLFLLLGIFSSSFQIIPSLELYKESSRSIIFQKINAIPFTQLATIISPDFYGNPVTRNDLLGHYIEWNMFTGTVAFFISIYSLFLKSRKVIFFILISVLSLVFSLDTYILDLIVNLKIPVLSTSSLSRILCLFSFSIAILAGFGIEKIIKDLDQKNYKNIFMFIATVLIVFLVLWTYVLGNFISPDFSQIAKRNLILPSLFSIGLIMSFIIGIIKKQFIKFTLLLILIFVIIDMLRFSTKWQPFESKELAYIETPIISELKSLDPNYRIFTPFGEEGSVYFNFQSTGGYDPLYIKRYGEFTKSLSDGKLSEADRLGAYLPKEGKYFPKFIDFLGIKYVLQKKSDIGKPWAFRFNEYSKDKFKLIYEDKDFQIFENLQVFPKAYLAKNYVVETNNQEILNKIYSKDFNLKTSVVLEKNPKIKVGEGDPGEVKIISYKPNRIKLISKSKNNSILIMSDNFYPGWVVKVNNSHAEIIRANYTFRAIPIPKGENNIEISYEPKSFQIAKWVSISTVLLLIIIITIKWYNLGKWIQHKSKIAKFVTKSNAKIVNGKQTKKKH